MKKGVRMALAACAALLVAGGVVLWQVGVLAGTPLGPAEVAAPIGTQTSSEAVAPSDAGAPSGVQRRSALGGPTTAGRPAETAYAMRYVRTAPGEFFIRIQSTPIHDPMVK